LQVDQCEKSRIAPHRAQDARVLIFLLHNPGIRVGMLAELTCIEQSALSRQLRRLSKAKPADARTRRGRQSVGDDQADGERAARGAALLRARPNA
jgi:hypothetical protein